MRRIPLLAAAATALAVGCADAAPATTTSLTVTYYAQGKAPATKRWTLKCAPAAGTHPSPGRACRKLTALGTAAFASVPADAVCTQVFGGPQTALVTGTYRGRRIWARFSRRDGCQIARWNRHVPLLPSGSA